MQRIIGTIACPGSGKSTLSLSLNPLEWVTITLDDWRQALFPPHRRTYWDVRANGKDKEAQSLIHTVQQTALREALNLGWNVYLADTHIIKHAFEEELQIIQEFGLEVQWVVLYVPFHILLDRNNARGPDMRVPENILTLRFNQMWAEGAWWRKEKNVIQVDFDENNPENFVKDFKKALEL